MTERASAANTAKNALAKGIQSYTVKVDLNMPNKTLRVTLVRSPNRRGAKHKACVTGLGLRRINHSVEVESTPCNLGMIKKISYLLSVEEIA